MKQSNQSKKLRLHNGKYALVDKSSHAYLRQFHWIYRVNRKNGNEYAYRHTPRNNYTRKTIYLHWEVAGFKNVDHKNGNGLDNRRNNLRRATRAQNQWNKIGKKLKGAVFDRRRNVFYSTIKVNKKRIFLGTYTTVRKAHAAYVRASKKYHGEFSLWNR